MMDQDNNSQPSPTKKVLSNDRWGWIAKSAFASIFSTLIYVYVLNFHNTAEVSWFVIFIPGTVAAAAVVSFPFLWMARTRRQVRIVGFILVAIIVLYPFVEYYFFE